MSSDDKDPQADGRPEGNDQPADIPNDEVEPEAKKGPPPSLVLPGFKQVRIVDGQRVDEDPMPDPHAVTPPSGTRAVVEQPDPPTAESEAQAEAEAEAPSGNESTIIGPPGSSPGNLSGREATLVGDSGQKPPATPLSGREATMVPGEDSGAPSTPVSGRESTMVGDIGTPAPPTPISGREATMVGTSGSAPSTPVSGREGTIVGPGDATAATYLGSGDAPGDTQATVGPGMTAEISSDDDTQATMARGSDNPTPSTYSGRPRTGGPGSSASFDANWHLAGRKGPHTGQTWGDFALGGILGEGGMGAVYRAMQLSLKRRVAIKVLPPNLAQDSRLLERFHLEASTASKLSSPHIVQVYYIGDHDDNHYYAMEYVDGTDLYEIHKERMDADQPMTSSEAADYILQGARGLAEAGRYGIVHRDIKPPNMMVDKGGLLKIADFGIVKVLGEHQLTMTGQAVGTPAYCSPEQGRGDGEIDQRSDLYSLGVVFYELACGRRPFEATTPNALIYKHCFEEPELPQTINPDISNEFQAVILRLLQKKPENRYQSADELVRDLEALKTGAMLESALANVRGTGASEAKREQMSWFQRNLTPILAVAAVVLAIGGYIGYTVITQQARQELEARRATEDLRPPIVEVLDATTSIPPEIESLVDEYAKIDPDGEEDADVMRWRAKLARVANLQQQLAILDDGIDNQVARQAAVLHLADYVVEVGPEDGAAQRWQSILATLDLEEEEARQFTRTILGQVVISQTARDQLNDRVGRLAHLAGDDDREVLQARDRIARFDEQVASLTNELNVLDTDAAITETVRVRLLAALAELSPRIGESDQRILRWRQILDDAGGLVADVRQRLSNALGSSSSLALTTIDDVQGDIDLLARLVDESDRDLTNWRAQIDSSLQRVATRRQKLAQLEPQLDSQGTLLAPQIAPLRSTIDELADQTGTGDSDVLRWNKVHRETKDLIERLQADVQRLALTNSAGIPVAERKELADKLALLVTKEGINPGQAAAFQQRIEDEAARVAALQERLQAMDEVRPFTSTMEEDLTRLAIDLNNEGEDLQRWIAKRNAIIELRESLAVLDERRSVSDDIEEQFQALVELVGPDAPEILRWQSKFNLIAELRARLAPLEEAVPLPDSAAADLALWAEQVGNEDPTWLRYTAKVERVGALKQSLGSLSNELVVGPQRHTLAHEEIIELVGLIGPTDLDIQSFSRRLEEIDGPTSPAWASSEGRDEFGRWADLTFNDLTMRFRYVPPGTFTLGSVDGEADEVPIETSISTGFWIGDSEVTQAWWSALMGSTPAYFRSDKRPVERIALDEAQAFCAVLMNNHAALNARLPSEAEWEFACRAGAPAPSSAERAEVAWFASNSNESTQQIRQRYANALGLYDMLGNVAEWTADSFGAYPTVASIDPRREGGKQHVVRGGSWGDAAERIRPANRIAVDPELRSVYLGMRCLIPAAFSQPPTGDNLLTAIATDVTKKTFTWNFGQAFLSLTLPGEAAVQNSAPEDLQNEAADQPAPATDTAPKSEEPTLDQTEATAPVESSPEDLP